MEQSGTDRDGRYVYFPGSGHYIRGQFWEAFASRGGLTALGFPRTEQLVEGGRRVQYFQNGVLATDHSGRIIRLPLGLTLLPIPMLPPPAPHDGSGTPTVNTIPPSTATVPSATAGSHSQATVFTHFYRAHPGLLGPPVTGEQWTHGFLTQVFAYGALTYDGRTHAVMLLPVGDRWLATRSFLPERPGNAYPPGYAPLSVQRTIGWLSSA